MILSIAQTFQEIELRELALADADDIFRTIDTHRGYLGKWRPFVESVVGVPAEKYEPVFVIRCRGICRKCPKCYYL